MYTTQRQPSPVMTSGDYHEAAAENYEAAAKLHHQAAALYAYGDYQQASEQGQLAKDLGEQAQVSSVLAIE